MTRDNSASMLRRAAQYDRDNLAWARRVLASEPERLPFELELARLILKRLAPGELPPEKSIDQREPAW